MTTHPSDPPEVAGSAENHLERLLTWKGYSKTLGGLQEESRKTNATEKPNSGEWTEESLNPPPKLIPLC